MIAYIAMGILGTVALGALVFAYMIWKTAQKQIAELAAMHKAKDLGEYAAMKNTMTPKEKIKMVEKQNELALGAEKLAIREKKESRDELKMFGIGAR